MDKHTFNELVNKKYITEVGRVDYYKKNDEELEALKMDDLASMVTNSVVGGFIGLPDFSQGGEFKLEKNVNLLYPIVIENDTVIDLNGYNIINNTTFIDESDGSDNCYAFWVKSGKLTIKGKGEVEATANSSYDMAVWANGGDVEIYGGSYSNRGDSCDLIYACAGGNVTIFGGEFMAGGPASGKAEGTKNPYCALNVKDADYKAGKSNIVVKGGKFYNFDPANNVSETAETNFLAPGYISVEVAANVFVVEDTSDIVVDEGESEE
jgi:hypothetical protein